MTEYLPDLAVNHRMNQFSNTILLLRNISLIVGFVLFPNLSFAQDADAEKATSGGKPEVTTPTQTQVSMPPEIYVVAKEGRLKKLQSLITQGADVNATNKLGRTALMGAIYFHNKRIVEELLIEGADVDAVDNNGRTALMMAIRKKDRELTLMLLEAGADVTIADKKNKTVLMIAKTMKDKKLTKLLEATKPADSGKAEK